MEEPFDSIFRLTEKPLRMIGLVWIIHVGADGVLRGLTGRFVCLMFLPRLIDVAADVLARLDTLDERGAATIHGHTRDTRLLDVALRHNAARVHGQDLPFCSGGGDTLTETEGVA